MVTYVDWLAASKKFKDSLLALLECQINTTNKQLKLAVEVAA